MFEEVSRAKGYHQIEHYQFNNSQTDTGQMLFWGDFYKFANLYYDLYVETVPVFIDEITGL